MHFIEIDVPSMSVIERDANEAEIQQIEALALAAQKAADDAAAREAALESGRAKLLALGLTESEVAAMTNG